MRGSLARFWKRHPRLEASLVTVLGLLVLFGGMGGYSADHELSAHGVRTTGVVVGVHPGRAPAYDVRFSPSDGDVRTERTSYAVNGARIGDSMLIDYDPRDPSIVAQAGARSNAWILWGGWLLAGVALVLGACRLWFRACRRPDRPAP